MPTTLKVMKWHPEACRNYKRVQHDCFCTVNDNTSNKCGNGDIHTCISHQHHLSSADTLQCRACINSNVSVHLVNNSCVSTVGPIANALVFARASRAFGAFTITDRGSAGLPRGQRPGVIGPSNALVQSRPIGA